MGEKETSAAARFLDGFRFQGKSENLFAKAKTLPDLFHPTRQIIFCDLPDNGHSWGRGVQTRDIVKATATMFFKALAPFHRQLFQRLQAIC